MIEKFSRKNILFIGVTGKNLLMFLLLLIVFLYWVDIPHIVWAFIVFVGLYYVCVAIYGSKFLHEVRNIRIFSSNFWMREFALARGIVREIHNLGNLAEKVEHYVVPEDREEFEKEKKNTKSK